MRYAEIARELLRLLEGGGAAAAAVELRQVSEDGTAADEEPAAAELLRAMRPEFEGSEDGADSTKAEDAALYRIRRRAGVPEEEADEIPMRMRYGDPAGEPAARRSETEPEPRVKFKPRQTPEDAEGASAETQERQRLSAALEALSGGRLQALLQGPNLSTRLWPEGSGETGGAAESGVPASGAAVRNGDPRSDPAGNGAEARDFPSSGALVSFSGTDPEAVSEFFRRDSRRYDAGFGGI